MMCVLRRRYGGVRRSLRLLFIIDLMIKLEILIHFHQLSKEFTNIYKITTNNMKKI